MQLDESRTVLLKLNGPRSPNGCRLDRSNEIGMTNLKRRGLAHRYKSAGICGEVFNQFRAGIDDRWL